MTSRRATLLLLIGLVAIATACTPVDETSRAGATRTLGADFGNAVAHNAAQQIIDPLPRTATTGAPPLDGHRARLALERYERGAVVAPERVETTTFGDDR